MRQFVAIGLIMVAINCYFLWCILHPPFVLIEVRTIYGWDEFVYFCGLRVLNYGVDHFGDAHWENRKLCDEFVKSFGLPCVNLYGDGIPPWLVWSYRFVTLLFMLVINYCFFVVVRQVPRHDEPRRGYSNVVQGHEERET